MADGITIDVRGEKGLINSLNSLTKTGQKASVRKALRKSAKPIQKRVKATAPRKSGRLRRSVKLRSLKRSRTKFGIRVTTSSRGNNLFTGKAFYGGFLEYGRKTGKRGSENRREIPGLHFIEKAADQLAPRVTKEFAKSLAEEIEKTAIKEANKVKG